MQLLPPAVGVGIRNRMTAHSFRIEQRPVPGTHTHGWVAVDEDTGDEIDLTRGGTGDHLGRYPEIARYLSDRGVPVVLEYSPHRSDTLDCDYRNNLYTWTFATGGGIVVKDIPRTVFALTLASSS